MMSMKSVGKGVAAVAASAVAVQVTKRVTQHYKLLTRGMTAASIVEGCDLHGRWVMITGTTDGIGKETARALFNAGASVVMVSRSSEKLQRVKDEFERGYSGVRPMPQLLTMAADLSLRREVRRVCDEYLERDLPLHVFIGNAGMLNMHFRHTDEGMEEHMATHCLANFAMANLLLPRMIKSCHARHMGGDSEEATEGRIVMVSSNEHRFAKLVWDDLNWHKRQPTITDRLMWRTYGDAKLAQSLITRALAYRLSKAHINITANFVQPGPTETMLHRNDPYSHFRGWLTGFRAPEQGADVTCFVAIRDEALGRSGEYWKDNQVMKASPKVNLPDAQRMWALCEQMTGVTWNVDPAESMHGALLRTQAPPVTVHS